MARFGGAEVVGMGVLGLLILFPLLLFVSYSLTTLVVWGIMALLALVFPAVGAYLTFKAVCIIGLVVWLVLSLINSAKGG